MKQTLDRVLYRAAMAIRERLLALRGRVSRLDPPEPNADEIGRLVHQYDRALRRRWDAAAVRLRNRLWNVVSLHATQIDGLLIVLRSNPQPVPDLADLYRDLVALRGEFDEVRFDPRKRQLVVRTGPITLEGVPLGRFDVVLHLARIGEPSPYDVVAVDPHPAGSNEGVTHPHVDHDRLCEGEGRIPIVRALEAGRSYDFFTIVDRILRTYNASSPYVALGDWAGTECRDCGRTVDGDERQHCEDCDADLCDDCEIGCSQCSEPHCGDCLHCCHDCDDTFCSTCLRACAHCGDDFCPEHIDDDRLCTTCREENDEEEEEASTTPAAADALRLGQAAVPA